MDSQLIPKPAREKEDRTRFEERRHPRQKGLHFQGFGSPVMVAHMQEETIATQE